MLGFGGGKKERRGQSAASAQPSAPARKPPPIELLQLRNPPMAGGVPFFAPEDLLRLHSDLLLQVRLASGASDEDFAKYYMVAARNYAAFVHALPASRAHHHRGSGGMLRHGLEVAFFALRHIEGQFFSRVGTPEQRRNDEPRWRLATFLAALCHDLGKVACDITVFDSTKRLKWTPFKETLEEWGIKHNLDVYHPQWNEGREYHAHEPVSAICADYIITPAHRAYLCEGNPSVVGGMMMAIIGSKAMAQNLVLDAVSRADSDSTTGSLKASHAVVDGILTTDSPAEALMSVARRLVLESWKVNIPGSQVAISEEAAWLIWPTAFDDIKARARSEGTLSSIVQDPDQAAQNLINAGFATKYQRQDGAVGNLWRIVPKYQQATGSMARWALKLTRNAALYEGYKGPFLDVQVVETAMPNAPASTDSDFDQDSLPPAASAASGSSSEAPASAPPPSGPAAAAAPEAATPSSAASPGAQVDGKTARREKRPEAPAAPPPTPQPAKVPDPASDAWLRRLGETGVLLGNLLQRAETTGTMLQTAHFNGEPSLIFEVPTIEELLGIGIKDLASMLDEHRLLLRDDKSPTLFTVIHPTRTKTRVLAFTAKASSQLLSLVKESVKPPPAPPQAAAPPSPGKRESAPRMEGAAPVGTMPQTELFRVPKYPPTLNQQGLKVLLAQANASVAGFVVRGHFLYGNVTSITEALTREIPGLSSQNVRDWCVFAGARVLKPQLAELKMPSLAPAYCFNIQGEVAP